MTMRIQGRRVTHVFNLDDVLLLNGNDIIARVQNEQQQVQDLPFNVDFFKLYVQNHHEIMSVINLL